MGPRSQVPETHRRHLWGTVLEKEEDCSRKEREVPVTCRRGVRRYLIRKERSVGGKEKEDQEKKEKR